jgi:PAS domain S-box-containing protein
VSAGAEETPAIAWRRLFEHAADPQLVTDPGGRILAANAAATRLLHSPACPLLGGSLVTITSRRDRGRVRALLRRVREGRPPVLESEINLEAPTGWTTSVAVTLVGLHDEADHLAGMGWSLRLVGQPRSLAGRLQRSRQEASDLRTALDQAAAILEVDRDGRIRVANERCTDLLERAHEELVGCTAFDLGLGRGVENALSEIRRRVIRGRAWAGELPVRTAGGAVRWVNATVVPLLDADGRPRRYIALLHDVTPRRQAVERIEQEKGLVHLGAMAAVVAHEVRNPLAAAQGALEVIGPRVPDAEDREVLADVRQRLSQLNELVNEILLFARPRSLKLEERDLVELVARVIRELEDDPAMNDIELTLERPPGSLPLRLDEAAIRGVILNLLRNAAEAMEGHGRIQMGFEQDEKSCRLRVRDEGPGIPEDMRENVFEAFVSTRHRGSGLGLAISRNTAEAHGGELRLEPAPGRGTDAVLELPSGALSSGSREE